MIETHGRNKYMSRIEDSDAGEKFRGYSIDFFQTLSAGFQLLVEIPILKFSPQHSQYSQILDMTGAAAAEFESGGRSPDNYRLCK